MAKKYNCPYMLAIMDYQNSQAKYKESSTGENWIDMQINGAGESIDISRQSGDNTLQRSTEVINFLRKKSQKTSFKIHVLFVTY